MFHERGAAWMWKRIKEVFQWILGVLAKEDLVDGKTIGVDATTLEANAAQRSIVRRGTGDSYEEYLNTLAKASGIETPTRKDRQETPEEGLEPGLGAPEGPGCSNHQDERRPQPPCPQVGACRGHEHRSGGCRYGARGDQR